MSITEEQRIIRQKYLGSSDAAAILGLDPWRNAADIFYSKTQPLIEDKQTDAIEVGNYCEQAVIRWFEKKKKLMAAYAPQGQSITFYHANGFMAANIDACIVGDNTQIIEAKTSGITSKHFDDNWGEIETDQVPERIAIQCLHQMAVLPDVRVVWVPVLMGGVGFRYYYVERNDSVIADLTTAEEFFWRNHIEKNIPPPEIPSKEFLKKRVRETGKAIPINDELINEWLLAKGALKEAESTKEEMEKRVLNALGDAEIGESSIGKLTYFQRERKEYTVSAMIYRQLSFKKAKE